MAADQMQFAVGDLVEIRDTDVPVIRHFAGRRAVIVGHSRGKNMARLCWSGDGHMLLDDEYLSLLERDRIDILPIWREQEKADYERESDLDYIFSMGQRVLVRPNQANIDALARCIYPVDLAPSTEAYHQWMRAVDILRAAHRYLLRGDKEGWLKACEEVKSRPVSQ